MVISYNILAPISYMIWGQQRTSLLLGNILNNDYKENQKESNNVVS
jgi:hypothetical protein